MPHKGSLLASSLEQQGVEAKRGRDLVAFISSQQLQTSIIQTLPGVTCLSSICGNTRASFAIFSVQIQSQEKQYEEGSNCLGCADRLYRAGTGSIVWSRQRDRKLADVLAPKSPSKWESWCRQEWTALFCHGPESSRSKLSVSGASMATPIIG